MINRNLFYITNYNGYEQEARSFYMRIIGYV